MGGGEEVLPHWMGSSGSLGKVCVCSLNQKEDQIVRKLCYDGNGRNVLQEHLIKDNAFE